MKLKFFQGYIENRMKELMLAVMFGVLMVIGRSVKLPIFGIATLDFGAVFWISSILVLSYPYVWLFTLLLCATSAIPILIIPVFLFALHVAYFISRFVGFKRSKWIAPLFAYLTAIGDIFILIYFLKLYPDIYVVPSIIQATTVMVQVAIFCPIILKVLEKFGVIMVD